MDIKNIKDKDLKLAITETLRVISMLDSAMEKRVIDEMNSCKDEEELKEYLCNEIVIYQKLFQEISKETINKVIESERIIISEQVQMNHLMKGTAGKGPITTKKHIIIPLCVRANQQKSFKDGKSSEDASMRNVANQLAGDSKTGTFSDTEIMTTNIHGGTNILKEILGVTSHDMVAYRELQTQILKTGEATLEGLTNESKNKGSLIYTDHILKHLGFDSDIISTPEK